VLRGDSPRVSFGVTHWCGAKKYIINAYVGIGDAAAWRFAMPILEKWMSAAREVDVGLLRIQPSRSWPGDVEVHAEISFIPAQLVCRPGVRAPQCRPITDDGMRARRGNGDVEPLGLAEDGWYAGVMMKKRSGVPNPGTYLEVIARVDEESPIRMKHQPAPLLTPRWAPTVVVVSRQMPGVGLSWGRMDAGGSGGGKTR
jgi:hypothetical protein